VERNFSTVRGKQCLVAQQRHLRPRWATDTRGNSFIAVLQRYCRDLSART
jgi:hypothetical protein